MLQNTGEFECSRVVTLFSRVVIFLAAVSVLSSTKKGRFSGRDDLMHESVEPGLLPDFCNVSDRTRENFYLYPLPNLIPTHFFFTQNLPKAILMPINKRYLSHSYYHL